MIEIDMNVKGLEEVQSRLEEVAEVAIMLKGVDLLDVQRETVKDQEKNITNNYLLSMLKKTGRDFVSPDDSLYGKISRAFIEEFDIRWNEETAKIKPLRGRGMNAAYKGLIAAMQEYMKYVSYHIEHQIGTRGTGLKPLSEKYKKWKMKTVGFLEIGKLTGELIKNLNPSGPTSRMKIIK